MSAIRWRTNCSIPMWYIAGVAIAATQNGAFFFSPCILTTPNCSLTTYSSKRRTIIASYSKPQISSCTCCSNVSLIEEGRGAGGIRSPDLIDLEYKDLNLKEKLGHVGHVRIRQHVNPLSSSFSVPCQVPNWDEVFKDSKLPLMVDIGSGSGRFLIWLAKRFSESRNYLGLEIRQKLVKRAQFWVDELELKNIYFMFANAAVSFDRLVATYPGPLMMVSVLCPDPHFKKRHHKRRVVQKPLVDSITRNLRPGGQVFLQSDVLEVAEDMRNQFDGLSDSFKHVDRLDSSTLCDAEGWLLSNPMGIRTEREIHAELEGARLYRRMYQKQGSDP